MNLVSTIRMFRHRSVANAEWLTLRPAQFSLANLGPDDEFHGGIDGKFVGSDGDAGVFTCLSKRLDQQF